MEPKLGPKKECLKGGRSVLTSESGVKISFEKSHSECLKFSCKKTTKNDSQKKIKKSENFSQGRTKKEENRSGLDKRRTTQSPRKTQ